MRIAPLVLSLLALTTPAAGTTYYVHGEDGDDKHAGTTPDTAWRSLDRVNAHVFQPGDAIRFRAGTRYRGQLRPQGSGAISNGETRVIQVGSYGEGPRPRIDGEGKYLDAVLIRNVAYWELTDLEVTNQGAERVPWRTGVRIVADGCGKMRHIRLKNLYVHDVNGDLRKSHEGCGIYFESRGGDRSHFDDLRIENCLLRRTDRNGICQRRGRGASRSLGVVIRGNRLEDIGGDGIKVWGSNGALVEHNVLRGGRMRCPDYAAGIWPWDSDDTVIQFNEVSGMRGVKDGQAFDSDYRCRRSVFQYNYSHDNDGGFMLICSPGHSYCEDTIIRYNISQNDGVASARVFHFGGGSKDTRIYNNTIYIGPEQHLPLFLFTEWDRGNAHDVHVYNNIFYVEGKVTYSWGKSRNVVFENNVFYGTHVNPPSDPHAITRRPPIERPGSGRDGFASLGGYRMRPGADVPVGRIVDKSGGRDFFGHAVPAERPPTIGAHQVTTDQRNAPTDAFEVIDMRPHWNDRIALANPHKGWYHHYPDNHVNKYVIRDDAHLLDFPGMDHLYIRLAWAYLEPKEGQFDWDFIDGLIAKWVAKGLGIAFRISCKETSTDRIEQQFATPRWVMEAGAEGNYYRNGEAVGADGPWEPRFDDPVFLAKLESFVRAFAARYDGKQWLRYVDIGSIGDWGEGHTHSGSRLEYSYATRKMHVDLYRKHFTRSQLIISDDYVYALKDPKDRDRLHRHILKHGIGYRDDSILVDYYVRAYADTATVRSPELFAASYKASPQVLELQHYAAVKRDGNWRGKPGSSLLTYARGKTGADILREAIDRLHATYIGYHGDAHEWLTDNPELTKELLNRCGYWFFLQRVQVPKEVHVGATGEVRMDWENRGVAPAYHPYRIRFRFEGPVVEDVELAAKNRNWMPKPAGGVCRETYAVRVPGTVPPGEYQLKFKLISTEERRDVLLALDRAVLDRENYCTLTTLQVRGAR